MTTMKAYVRLSAESGEVQMMDMPLPSIRSGEGLVRVRAFGVGIHDRSFIPRGVKFPYTVGTEGAGTLVEVGDQVTGFSPGDRVIFAMPLQPQGGAWAEYAAANQSTLMALPEQLTYAQGAALLVAGKAALASLEALGLRAGERLFVVGASGAIGSLVIQLAAAQGLRVAGSASERNHDYMKALGLEWPADYHDPDWPAQIKAWSGGGVDAALAIQPGTGKASQQVVKDGGKVVTVSGDSAQIITERQITAEQITYGPDIQRKVTELIGAVASGAVQLVIEHEYPFAKALDALQKTETRHARGKLVVTLP